jgi:hypothetical protein
MNHAEQTRTMGEFFDGCLNLQNTKGKDYTGDGDAYKDLEEEACAVGVRPEQVLWIAMNKHYKAVRRFCSTGEVKSEPIEGRLMDLVNYAFLIYAYQKAKKEKVSQC